MLEKASGLNLSVNAKSSLLMLARRVGLFQASRYLRRNSKSLLILCYHGISKSDEHLWKPSLYMAPTKFRQRLKTIRASGLDVLPLSEALEKVERGTLTRPAVAITFDDGWHDFYTAAWPLLREFDFPATVYQTTYYSFFNRPVFDTTCSYLLWQGIGKSLRDPGRAGFVSEVRINSIAEVDETTKLIRTLAAEQGFTARQKDRFLAVLADQLGLSFDAILSSRTLHLMNPDELAEVSRGKIDIQLHTHRHRLPLDRGLFLNEIARNQELIEEATGRKPEHFCYPNGAYRHEISPWLREAGVRSATTTDPGMVSKTSDSMFLPRFTDSNAVSQVRFESWLAGIGVFGQSVQQSAAPAPVGGSSRIGEVASCEAPSENADVSSVL